MDRNGKIILPPTYDAIGEFRHSGFAVVQKDGKAGLLKDDGTFQMPIKFKDIRVITDYLFGVQTDDGIWEIRDVKGNTLLKDYDKAIPFTDEFLKFDRDGKRGIFNLKLKRVMLEPSFDQITLFKDPNYFLLKNNGRYGLSTLTGKICLPTKSREIESVGQGIILYRSKYKWGVIDRSGNTLLPEQYSGFRKAGQDFIIVTKQGKNHLFSFSKKDIIGLEPAEDFFPLTKDRIAFKKLNRVGLMDGNGSEIIPPSFQEIRLFSDNLFRVRMENKWGIVNIQNELITPITLDFISVYKEGCSIVKSGDSFGLADQKGKVVVNPVYDKIALEENAIKAYRGPRLTIFQNAGGKFTQTDDYEKFASINVTKKAKSTKEKPEENYQLNHFEWFYSTEKSKWGLRDLSNGATKISPRFDFIDIRRDIGLTIAGERKTTKQSFGGFIVRYEDRFCVINNKMGAPTTQMDLRNIKLEDYRDEGKVCRVIFDDGRHGLLDREGKIVTETYSYIGPFNEGIAPVAIEGMLWGSKKSDVFAICNLIDFLEEGYGSYILGDFGDMPKKAPNLTCKDCLWGYMDIHGEMVIPAQFEGAREFNKGSGIVMQNGKWGLVNVAGELVIPCAFDKLTYFENNGGTLLHAERSCNKFGLIDSLGKMVVNAQFEKIGEPMENIMAAKRGEKWGYVNTLGQIIVDFKYTKARTFREGYAAVFDGYKWGFIDKTGKTVVEHKFSRVGDFHNGLAWVNTPKGSGYITPNGMFAISPKFKKAYDFSHDIGRVLDKGKMRLISKDGKFISDRQFDDISSFDRYGRAVARDNSRDNIKYFLVNRKGERISNQTFRKVFSYSEGLAAVKKKNKYGFVDLKGNLVIPAVFDRVSQFSEGRAWVKMDGNCGYIDKGGNIVVDLEFSKCQDFEDGRAVVFENARKGGLVDTDGDYVIKPSLNKVLSFSEGRLLMRDDKRKYYFSRETGELYDGYYDEAGNFDNGFAFVRINEKWGVINHKGVLIISPKYEKIERVSDGLVKVKINRLHGVYNVTGNSVLPVSYEYIRKVPGGLIRVEQGGNLGYLDENGNWVRKMTE